MNEKVNDISCFYLPNRLLSGSQIEIKMNCIDPYIDTRLHCIAHSSLMRTYRVSFQTQKSKQATPVSF